jgi:YD repeat-containing protein
MSRTYRSQLDYNGPLGFGWDFTYNDSLFPQANGDVVRVNGKGHIDRWLSNVDGSYTAPAGFFRTLVREADGSYVTRSPEGFKRFYATDGRLEAHEDRHGNTMRFEYDLRGNLARVIDAYGRMILYTFAIFPGNVDRLVRITDFAGREVVYSYDQNGDLVSVRTPTVTATSTGNDFPDGKTERYVYSFGFAEEELNHNLLNVTYPQEVAEGGPAALMWTYGEDPNDPLNFDRVLVESVGGGRSNASGVPAGGDLSFQYEMLNMGVPLGNPDVPPGKVTLTERNGNVLEYFTNERQHHIITRRRTRGLRQGEPEFYETVSSFDADGQLLSRTFPEGNQIRRVYDSGSRAGAQNVIEIRLVADAQRGGGEDLVTTMAYEPLYRQVAWITDPRGNASGFEAAVGVAVRRALHDPFLLRLPGGDRGDPGRDSLWARSDECRTRTR